MHHQNNNLGEQFKSAVSDAINNGDFQKLNFLVTDTVTDVITEAGSQIKKATENVQKEFQNNSASDIYQNVRNYQQKQTERNQQFQNHSQKNPNFTKETSASSQKNSFTSQNTSNKLLPACKIKKIGQVSSILYIIFGAIGVGATGFPLLVGGLFAMLEFSWPTGIYIFLLVLLFACLLLIQKGIVQRKRLHRMKRYITLCEDNMYVNIKYLAKKTGNSISYVLKDVKKMLRLGFFPEGHLDFQENCLMLDDATYEEYLKLEQERKSFAEEEAKKVAEQATQTPQQQELTAMIQEGQDYIAKLHHLNDLIEDESVSKKLYRMESLLKEIFKRVKKSPEQMPKMRKLMNYYLPTTIKLLESYDQFDNISSPGADILSAKAEIEKTIDIINEAFVELLNKLFQTDAYDVTADAQVLQTMLAKEGLYKNKFSEEKL